jgi:hypothetical protein
MTSDLITSITGLVTVILNSLVATGKLSGDQANFAVQVFNCIAGGVLMWAKDRKKA